MAQRIIHYLIGEKLLDRIPHALREGGFDARFRMGNLLPDAYDWDGPDLPPRRLTHFVFTDESGDRYSDFGRFLSRYRERIPKDGLYLGYYLHLIEDACFRVFWHSQDLDARLKTKEDVSFLHRDYHILNKYLIEKYALENRLEPIEGFEDEALNEIHPFRAGEMLNELAADFLDRTAGEPRWFTPRLADEFLAFALPICTDALERLLSGAEPLDPHSLHWRPTA